MGCCNRQSRKKIQKNPEALGLNGIFNMDKKKPMKASWFRSENY